MPDKLLPSLQRVLEKKDSCSPKEWQEIVANLLHELQTLFRADATDLAISMQKNADHVLGGDTDSTAQLRRVRQKLEAIRESLREALPMHLFTTMFRPIRKEVEANVDISSDNVEARRALQNLALRYAEITIEAAVTETLLTLFIEGKPKSELLLPPVDENELDVPSGIDPPIHKQ